MWARRLFSWTFGIYEHAWAMIALVAAGAIDPESLEEMPFVCLLHTLTGQRCPGCGMTRAVTYLMHGRLGDAFDSNPLVVLVWPIIAYVAVEQLRTMLHRARSYLRFGSRCRDGVEGARNTTS